MGVGEQKYQVVDSCRVCKGHNLEIYLDLGNMPLVNSLEKPQGLKKDKFPLAVNFCHDCSLSQLTISVNPKILFSDYPYRSSVSNEFGRHCDDLANELNEEKLQRGDLVVDLASNDGYLLEFFQKRGNKVLGIDPAKNLVEIANKKGIKTLEEFWNYETSQKVLDEFGSPRLITAFNVFAHVPEIQSFTKGVKNLLGPNGYFIIESPHVQNLVENSEFDTIYHEHVSYLSAKAVKTLMDNNGLRIAKIKKFPIHGGSIRFYIEHAEGKDTSDGSLEKTLEEEEEKGIHSIKVYKEINKNAEKIKKDLVTLLKDLNGNSKKICAFGASAKGNILLNYCGLDNSLVDYVFDDTPEKQGFIFPGTKIPIVSRNNFEKIKPDYLILLAWNFAKELIKKTEDFRVNGGKYIIPIPQVSIL